MTALSHPAAWHAPRRVPTSDIVRAVAITNAAAVVAAIVGFVVAREPGAVAGAVAVAAAAAVRWTASGARVLDRLGAVPIASDQPRLHNLVRGLSSDLGVPAPEVWVFDGDANAAVTPGGAIAAARALVDDCTRTELEAVLAHCLVRVRAGLRGERAALFLGPLARVPPGCYAAAHDVEAAAVTRYPPALCAALAKARPRHGAAAVLWFAPASSRCSVPERIDDIADL